MNNRGLITTKDNNNQIKNSKPLNKININKSGKRLNLKDNDEKDEDIKIPDDIEYKENLKGKKFYLNKESNNESEQNEELKKIKSVTDLDMLYK